MKTVTLSDFRKNLKRYCDEVTDNKEVIVLGRKEGRDVVVVSLEQYNKYLDILEQSVSQNN